VTVYPKEDTSVTAGTPTPHAERLVLSLFPGIGLLDMAFEEEGFCVVRGPDLLWGGDVRRFHPPAGRFDGVIGGPPCQVHSGMSDLNPLAGRKHGDMIPEYERIVGEAAPAWFVMENVQAAPVTKVEGYRVDAVLLCNRSLGEAQQRKRRFSFGSLDGSRISHHVAAQLMGVAENPRRELVVLAGHGPAAGQRVRGIEGRTWQEGARLQGLSDEWITTHEANTPFTVHGFKKVVGNGVPLPMGRAIAKAVKAAMYPDSQAGAA
jgi:DNA (cytosine-5)-methyltransferase 1